MKNDFLRRNAANFITFIRIPCAFGIAASEPFSVMFYIFLIIGGLSDAVDGPVARHISGDSPLGAALDSISDLCFFGATVFSVLIKKFDEIGEVAKILFTAVVILRIVSYLIQLVKFKKPAPLHTILNKLASVSIFVLLFVIPFIGITAAAVIASSIGIAGGIEEIVIHMLSDEARSNTLSVLVVLKERKKK